MNDSPRTTAGQTSAGQNPAGHRAAPPAAPPPPPKDATPGRAIDEGRGRIFPCEQCGGELVFNIGDQHLKCPHCGFEKPIVVPPNAAVAEQDFRAMLERLKQQRTTAHDPEQAEPGENHLRCESCGGTVVFVGTLTSSECPYCGSPVQREHVHAGGWRIPVDGILPFTVPRESAAANLAQWVRSRWFAPNDFLRQGVSGKFNGVYLPFWTFDAMTANAYSGQRGEHYWETEGSGDNKRQVRRTRWWPVSGSFQRFFDDILVAAGQGVRRDLVDDLQPWPLARCMPFTQEVLAGFLARTYDIELAEGFNRAQELIHAAIEQDVRERIGGDEQSIENIRTGFGALTFKHLLLPVWLLAYRYRGRAYQVLVNASTGEVDGERPYSPWKISFASVLGILGAAILVYFFNHR